MLRNGLPYAKIKNKAHKGQTAERELKTMRSFFIKSSRGGLLLACALFLSALLPGCQRSLPKDMQETLQGEAARMEDGETVFLWRDIFSDESYRLSDGTVLLSIRSHSWPWNTSVSGLRGFEGMSETAQQAVKSYFEEQGTLYDWDIQLSAAYADYRQCLKEAKKPEASAFQSHPVWQEAFPTSETERFTAFCISLMLPKDSHYDGTINERRFSLLFDRQTGERIDAFSLFSVPEKEAAQALFECCSGSDTNAPSRAEFIRLLRPEYICWYPDALEIYFPPDLFSDFADGWVAYIPFSDLADILRPWALPSMEELPASSPA